MCRQYPSLTGRENFIKENVEAKYTALLEKHVHLATAEGRSQTHLQVSLALSSPLIGLPLCFEWVNWNIDKAFLWRSQGWCSEAVVTNRRTITPIRAGAQASSVL
jgi:hypothetical protein